MGSIEPSAQSRDASLRRIRHLTAAAGALAASATVTFGTLAATGAGHLAGTKVARTGSAPVIAPAAAPADGATTQNNASDESSTGPATAAPATAAPATAAPATTDSTPASQATSAPVATGSAPVAVSGGS